MQLQLTTSPRKVLQLLLWLRVFAIVSQSVTVVMVYRWLRIAIPVAAMIAVIAGLAVIALLTALRLRTALPATQLEVTIQLLLDITELTVLLYLSGGTTNPFASLYLIPVALAAVGLAWRYTVMITLACLCCYVWLIAHFTALTLMPMNMTSAFNLHIAGMHVTFAISIMLLAATLFMMAAAMRRRDQMMAALREDAMRQEHLSAMGVLAVGAAHELSTPLFSIAMLVSELKAARRIDQAFRDDLSLLGRQVQLCKDKLTTLLQAAGQSRSPETRTVRVREVLQEVLAGWSIIRPAIRLEVDWQGLTESPLVTVDDGFSQALINVLNNAADASVSRGSDRVQVAVMRDAQGIRLCIDDEGPGLSADMQQRVGKAVLTTKAEGFGLGLVLSHANLNRLNGDITLANRPEGGTRTMITLPSHSSGMANGRN